MPYKIDKNNHYGAPKLWYNGRVRSCGGLFFMKTVHFLLVLIALNIATHLINTAHADDEMILPDSESEIIPTSSSTNPPVIMDESDSNDVSDVEEYDG